MAELAKMIQPDVALITLIAPAHLEKLGSVGGRRAREGETGAGGATWWLGGPAVIVPGILCLSASPRSGSGGGASGRARACGPPPPRLVFASPPIGIRVKAGNFELF